MTKILTILTLLLVTISVKAEGFTIIGRVVIDQPSTPLEHATVRLLKASDSTFVVGTVTATKGEFTLKSQSPGLYLLQTSYIGYQSDYRPLTITKDSKRVDLGVINLKESSVEITETIVKGKLPEVVVKQDTIEFHADSYGVAEGSVVEELIRKLPGVELTAEGKIMVEGKEITKLLVDGRDFFGSDMEMTLKNLPASVINKIQVVDRKSEKDRMTGFESQEKEKIINLTIKEDKKRGVFGNLRGGYGTKNRFDGSAMANGFYGEDKLSLTINSTNGVSGGSISQIPPSGDGTNISTGVNLNKSIKKGVNLDGSIRYGKSNRRNMQESFAENFLPDSSYYTSKVNDSYSSRQSISSDFRYEIQQDTTLFLSIAPRIGYSKSYTTQNSSLETLSGESLLVNSQETDTRASDHSFNYGLTMLFNRQLNKPGRRLTLGLELSGTNGQGDGTTLSENLFKLESKPDSLVLLDQENISKNQSIDAGFNASWVEPITKKSFLQLSYNFAWRESDNNRSSYQFDGKEYAELDSTYSRSYRSNGVRQNISLNFRSSFAKYSYSFGVGLDPTKSTEETYVAQTTINHQEQTLLNYTPRANLMWNSGPTNIVFNYNGRSNTPTARDLSKVVEVLSPLSEYVGNPSLKSGFTHNASLQFRNYNRDKQISISLAARATLEQNSITNYSIYDTSTGKTTSSPVNVNGNHSVMLSSHFSMPLKNRKFQLGSYTQYNYRRRLSFSNEQENTSNSQNFREDINLNYNDKYISTTIGCYLSLSDVQNSLNSTTSRTTFDYGVRLMTRARLTWQLAISTFVNYNGKRGYTGGYNRDIVNWNAEISRTLFKKKADISVIWYDILNQVNNTSRSITASAITDSEWNTVGGYILLKFAYRFNWMKGQ
ncbi:MAG: outer membrane beta-barrel protein [Bacteroidales bacterium]